LESIKSDVYETYLSKIGWLCMILSDQFAS